MRWPVVLVSMPFMDPDHPSIQLGLLAAALGEHGVPARTLHANLDLAARVGLDRYRSLCRDRGGLAGEWLFAHEAFGAGDPDPDGLLHPDLRPLRTEVIPAYLDDLAASPMWDGVRVVGFSSTYQQNAASFALARRLIRAHPGIVTVFGGANFDGEMGLELVRAVECVDYAVIGEGEVALPALVAALEDGSDPAAVPGVACRRDGEVHVTPAGPLITEMDAVPTPDYAEYFRHREELGLFAAGKRSRVWLPIESARGCWWGAKHHCTFCGLNGSSMAFRAKSPDRVMSEISEQARRYGSLRFAAVDNIADMGYFTTLFPRLATYGLEFFYEIKANLRRDQIRTLAEAGVTRVQPGIESLSTRVLGLMRKGATAATNVNLLRWARYYGIDVAWNILWGFPGERAEDYADQAALAAHLRHLQPPMSAARLWVERFSPLFHSVDRKEPEPAYRSVYPADVDLDKVAYFFSYEVDGALPETAYGGLRDELREWTAAWKGRRRPVLRYRSAPSLVQVYDGRRPGSTGTYTFDGLPADVYLACADRPITAAAVRDRIDPDLPVEEVTTMLKEFQRLGLLMLDGPRALALAIPAGGRP